MTKAGLQVPNHVILPFIEGDGTGPDIWRASQLVFDAAVQKAYSGQRKVDWLEVFAGEKAFVQKGSWLPEATLESFKKHLIGIKGPLSTPIGGGIRSLNVALRQILDLYVCLRPVRHFKNVPSPVLQPQHIDAVIFRENTEDIYAGIEFAADTPENAKFLKLFRENFPDHAKKFRQDHVGIGIKPISKFGSERLIRASLKYSFENKRKSVTLVHKGNIMKFTEGAFRDYGYELATKEFRDQVVTERESWILDNFDQNNSISNEANAKSIEPGFDLMTPQQKQGALKEVEQCLAQLKSTHAGGKWKNKLLIRDAIADISLQQILTRPKDFDVVATMNLNGDYLSDALAAQVGGIGIAPGANINYDTGAAVFEATHGTAPKYANLDKVNPGSVILSGELMFRYMGWKEAADLIIKGLSGAIGAFEVTYDFHRLMPANAPKKLLKCSEFAKSIVRHM